MNLSSKELKELKELRKLKKKVEKQKEQQYERQLRYRNTAGGKKAYNRAYIKAKKKEGFLENASKRSNKYYNEVVKPERIAEQKKKGIFKEKKKPIRNQKGLLARVIRWSKETKYNSKQVIYNEYRRIKYAKNEPIVKKVKQEPFVDIGYIKDGKTIWTGQKKIDELIKDKKLNKRQPKKTGKKKEKEKKKEAVISNITTKTTYKKVKKGAGWDGGWD